MRELEPATGDLLAQLATGSSIEQFQQLLALVGDDLSTRWITTGQHMVSRVRRVSFVVSVLWVMSCLHSTNRGDLSFHYLHVLPPVSSFFPKTWRTNSAHLLNSSSLNVLVKGSAVLALASRCLLCVS